ncbi:MAG: CPBP family glutamic-type intramembrane protease [Clostridia bacterium]|nr:CPBP family glutamic-type intramembrane protease [Clostridia bacterium]
MSEVASVKKNKGWFVVSLIIIAYIGLYALNLLTPLTFSVVHHYNNYISRIWGWSEQVVGLSALVILIFKRKDVDFRAIGTAVILALINGLSIYFRIGGLVNAIEEGFIIIFTLLAGVILFKEASEFRIAVFEGGTKRILGSILWGIAFSLPLCILNNLYFYFTNGIVEFENIFSSAFFALNPGISEEIIFRFFIMAVCVYSLKGTASKRMIFFIATFLGVVPHSLNHLPDLFMMNPGAAVFMLVATSLLFGLPMAWLQWKRNLETAISFHWFIDFTRFFFGF